MVTVAVAFLLFLRCALLGKSTAKSSTVDSNSREGVPATAATTKPPEPKTNGTVVRKKMENGMLPGIAVNRAISSQASMQQLMANRKEFLRASVRVSCNLNEIPAENTSLSEESESSSSRSLAECMSVLKAPVRPSVVPNYVD